MDECEFCKIVRGDEPADVIYEDDSCLAFFPLNPATRGHTLVIPKSHVQGFWDATPEEAASVTAGCLRVAQAIRRALNPEGLNIINQTGEAAHQTVFHLHVHVVPRWKEDRLKVIWPPPSEHLEEVLDDVGDAIRDALKAT